MGVRSRLVTLGTEGFVSRKHPDDNHTLVEYLDTSTGKWLLIDPTFNVTFQRLDGARVGLEELIRLARGGGDFRIVTGPAQLHRRRVQDYYVPYRDLLAYA